MLPDLISVNSKHHNKVCFFPPFSLFLSTDQAAGLRRDSILNIKYGVSGDRAVGAHAPVPVKPGEQELLFKSIIILQRPVLDPCLAVGFLPFASDCLRVGQLVDMKWRVERLKKTADGSSIPCNVSSNLYLASIV